MTPKYRIRALIIGYGSIGKRHEEILNSLECDVAIVSRRPGLALNQYSTIADAITDWMPAYVVIASRTSEHENNLKALIAIGFDGHVLVEKPVFAQLRPMPAHQFSLLRVAFNLRCNPLMEALIRELSNQTIYAVHGYVGQYLPNWRPEQDYRKSYSASAKLGGGVLLDLSHDIDITSQLAGPWETLTATGGKVSSLDITSDDCFTMMAKCLNRSIATLSLNYLDRIARREYVILANGFSLKADFIAGTLERNGKCIFQGDAGRNGTYRDMHHRMLHQNGRGLCTISEALEILNTIEVCRRTAKSLTWERHE